MPRLTYAPCGMSRGDQPRRSRPGSAAAVDVLDGHATPARPVGRPRRCGRRRCPGSRPPPGRAPPTSTTSATCDDGRRRRGGHDRAEVAGGLAVDEVAGRSARCALISASRRGSGTRARSRGRRSCASPCPRRAACRPPVGAEERADAGAGGAHPLGEVALRHQLELDLARRGRARRRPTSRSAAGTSRSILRTRPASSSAARPTSPLPALLLTDRQVARAAAAQRVDQLDRLPGRAEAADQHGGAVRDAGDRLGRPSSRPDRGRRVTTRCDVLQHDGEALADADADRGHAPPVRRASRSTVGQGAEDPAAGGAERVADGDRAAAGVDDPGSTFQRVDAGQRLHGERLVELDRPDVGPSRCRRGRAPCWRPRRGRSRSSAGPARVRAAAGDPGQRVASEPGGGRLRAEQHGRRAVVERGGVAGGDGAVRAERRLQPRPGFSTVEPARMPSSRARSTPAPATTRPS